MPAPVRVLPQDIMNALLKWRGNVVAAAGEVGMAPNSMYERIDSMGLDLKAIRAQGAKPVIPITGNKGPTGMQATTQAKPGTQKNAAQAGPIFPSTAGGRRLGAMQQATAPAAGGEAMTMPIKTAPRRHQPIRVKPDQRDLLQRAAWELQARFQAATDENLILEQFIEERFGEWLASKMDSAEITGKGAGKKRGGGA